MGDKKNSGTKPVRDISEHSLDPTAIIQKPVPQVQPNQGGGNQQSAETTSSEGESKSNG